MFYIKKWRKFLSNFVSALMVVLLIASCTASNKNSSTSTSSGATSPSGNPQTISIYTALEDDQLKNYLPLFQKANPDIKVNIVRDSTGIVTAKLLAEKGNPQADAIWGLAVSSLLVADQKGLIEPYAPKGLENIRPEFKDDRTPSLGWH